MEQEPDSSKPHCPTVYDLVASSTSTNENEEMDESGPNILCSPGVSNTDLMKIKELNIDDTTNTEDCTNASLSKASVAMHSHKDTSVEMNSNGKIPNRDSGIDSPSCNVAGENFPNEEATEQKKTTRTGDLAEMDNDKKPVLFSSGEQKRDSAQDEDSDIDEGSSEEPEIAEVSKLECIDVNKVYFFNFCIAVTILRCVGLLLLAHSSMHKVALYCHTQCMDLAQYFLLLGYL